MDSGMAALISRAVADIVRIFFGSIIIGGAALLTRQTTKGPRHVFARNFRRFFR